MSTRTSDTTPQPPLEWLNQVTARAHKQTAELLRRGQLVGRAEVLEAAKAQGIDLRGLRLPPVGR